MDIFLPPLIQVLYYGLTLYSYLILAYVISSLLVNFQVLNPTQPIVSMILDFLWRISHPILAQLRRFIPPIGMFDVTPIVLLLIIYFLQGVLIRVSLSLT